MTTGLTIAAIILVLLCTWFMGFWNNVITFVNTIFAACIASNYFEPVADAIDGGTNSSTYLLDFVAIWLLFFLSFIILRTVTDILSKHKLNVDKWLEMTGRTVFSLATAWVFVCFMQFSFHTAPFPPGEGNFQARPDSVNFAGAPDRLWLGFLQSRSQGALAAALPTGYDANQLNPADRDLGAMVFDSKGDFIYKYYNRRLKLSQQDALRVPR
ncbi:MAG: CvpA family protein [Pirellulaceae bacterium]|nr:CvpA family protein [Pirellulaceae bacterium]